MLLRGKVFGYVIKTLNLIEIKVEATFTVFLTKSFPVFRSTTVKNIDL